MQISRQCECISWYTFLDLQCRFTALRNLDRIFKRTVFFQLGHLFEIWLLFYSIHDLHQVRPLHQYFISHVDDQLPNSLFDWIILFKFSCILNLSEYFSQAEYIWGEPTYIGFIDLFCHKRRVLFDHMSTKFLGIINDGCIIPILNKKLSIVLDTHIIHTQVKNNNWFLMHLL